MSDEDEPFTDQAFTARPPGDRRASPPVSLDVIAYQVGSLQTSIDRGLGQLERVMERGFDELKGEVASLSNRVSELERSWTRMDTRVQALELFKAEEDERRRSEQDRTADTLATATVDQRQLQMWKWIGAALVGAGALVTTTAAVVAMLAA